MHREFLRAIVAACIIFSGLISLSAGLLQGTSVAGAITAPACNGTNVSVASLNGPTFYTDISHGYNVDSQYVGFTLTNHETSIPSLWATLGNFRGQSSTLISLNTNEAPSHSLGSVSNGATATGFWFTTDSNPAIETTTNTQYQDLIIYNGNPASGGTVVCTFTNSFTSVQSLIASEANKVTNVISGTPVLGGTFTISQVGNTGTIGAGPASDPGVFYMTPASSDTWPASAFQLISTNVIFCSALDVGSGECLTGTTYTNVLHIANTNNAGVQGLYTANFVFKVVGGTASTTAVSPNVDIASGTQVKHTASLSSGIAPVAAPTNSNDALSLAGGTPSMSYPGGTEAYTVTPSGAAGLNYQQFTVTMPTGVTYVPGTSTWAGLAVANPTVSGQTLTFLGQFSYVDASSLLRFTLDVPPSAGTGNFITSVTGQSGQTTIGSAAGSSSPATVSITVNQVAATITPIGATIYQNGSASYPFAVNGLVNADTTATLATQGWTPPSCSSPYVPGTSGAGSYTITCASASSSDYSFSYTTATLNVLASTGSGLSYDKNGGSGTPPSTASGSLPFTVASASTISDTGYVFSGWCTSIPSGTTCSSTTYQPGELFSGSTVTTLYAIWSPVSVTVTFNVNGGAGTMIPEVFLSGVAQSLTTNSLSLSGFTFGGWTTQLGASTASYSDQQSISVSGNTTLYALWNKTVSVTYVDATCASGSVLNVDTTVGAYSFVYPASYSVVYPTFAGASPAYAYGCEPNNGNSGHDNVFAGWNTSSSATTATLTGWKFAGDLYNGPGNLTLYAIYYSYLNNASYLNYDANGGSGEPTVQSLGTGTTATLSSTIPTQSGYSFVSWCTVAISGSTAAACTTAGGTSYASGATGYTFVNASDNTLYAVWLPITYTLSYSANGGSGTAPPSQNISATLAALVASGSTISQSGYTFAGWNTEANGTGQSYAVGTSYYSASNLTLYAQWNANYAVSYSGNGATGGSPPATQIFSSGSVIISGVGSLVRSGFTFVGWNSAIDGSGATYLAGTPYSSGASLTLYAQWIANNTYQVSFNGNGATGGSPPANVSFNGGSSITISANSGSLTKTGYTFAGWNTANDASGTSYPVGAAYQGMSNLTLYAVWLPANTYDVTYSANGASAGTVPLAQTFTTGPVAISANTGTLTKTGYTFGGWNSAADGSGTAYPVGASYATLANLTLYATWTQIGIYTVVYSPNAATGGGTPPTQTFSTSPVSISANTGSLVRTGYNFIGWNTAVDGSGTTYSPGDAYSQSSSLSLYAQWVASNSYAVLYSANGGTGTVATQTFALGGSVTLLSGSGLVLSGYVFNDWNTEANGTGQSYAVGTSYYSAGNLTLYAQWATVPYSIAYDANGGSGSVALQSFDLAGGTNVSSGTGLTKSGSLFIGWNTASDGSGTSYVSGDAYDVPINLYLYAQWIPLSSYAVLYDANGGVGSVANQVFSLPGGSATIAAGTGLVQTGFTFAGWNTAANGTGQSYVTGTSYNTSGNLTLYAQWTVVAYSVFYSANGGTGSAPSTQSFTTTAPATIAGAGGVANSDYTFSGWNTAPDGTGETFAVGALYGLPYNLNLYALWLPTGDTVIFNANSSNQIGASGSMGAQSFTSGVTQAITPNAFAETGYTFASWNTANDGTGTPYSDAQSITISVGVTLYAQWTINSYTVTFDSNTGTGALASESENYSVATALSTNTFTKSGYAFTGWATSANGSVVYTDGANYPFASSTTLYAVWSANTDVVTFNNNTGSGSIANQNFTSGVATALSTNTFTKTGYTFAGWNTAANGLGTPYSDAQSITISVGVTLYAQWSANGVDAVTFNNNTGSGSIANQNFTSGVATALSTNTFTKTGYTFAGWNTAANGLGTPYSDAQSITISVGVTLYAQWTINSYTVTFDSNTGTGALASESENYSVATALSTNTFTKSGYAFTGWATSANGSVVYTDGASFPFTSSTTLYAQWTTVVITHPGGLGGGAPGTVTVPPVTVPYVPINLTSVPITVASTHPTTPEVNRTYQLPVPAHSSGVAPVLSISTASAAVCSIDASGLVTFSGVAGACDVMVTSSTSGGVAATPQVYASINVAPLIVSGSIASVAGKLKPVKNQIVKVAQPITLKLPTGSTVTTVTVNGKVVNATISASGQIELPSLVGPKDKVVVNVEVDGQVVSVPITPSNGLISLASVNFNFASTSLTAVAKSILQRVVTVVREHDFSKITLVGFTDVLTSAGFSNQKLSAARAAVVRAYVKALLGNLKVKIVISGKAAKDPIINSLAASARAVNRRVEILVQ